MVFFFPSGKPSSAWGLLQSLCSWIIPVSTLSSAGDQTEVSAHKASTLTLYHLSGPHANLFILTRRERYMSFHKETMAETLSPINYFQVMEPETANILQIGLMRCLNIAERFFLKRSQGNGRRSQMQSPNLSWIISSPTQIINKQKKTCLISLGLLELWNFWSMIYVKRTKIV